MSFGYIPHHSPLKDRLLRLFGWPNVTRRLQAPTIFKFIDLKKTDVVADVGCGGGEFSFEIAKMCQKCVAIDINISRKARSSFKNASNLHLINGDILYLPFSKNCFDKILLSSVLQMVEDDEKLLLECYNILKNHGELILSIPTNYVWLNRLNGLKKDLKAMFGSKGKGYYAESEIKNMLNTAGFSILNSTYAPKNLGSLLYEIWLYACYRFRLPLYSELYFIFLYPFAIFDRYLKFKIEKGNELIIHAKK